MKCDLCGRDEARRRRMTRTYGQGRGELLIRNVPVVACASCGETYMTAATLYEIERIKLHRRSLAERRPVDVVEFGGRAPLKARPNLPLQRAAQGRRR
jgi:YgiT-type zinc finger domain-containing protein